jgi:peptide/nickel transport system substrate-binding protein
MGAAVVALAAASPGCAPAERPEGTVVYASGSDLESANPLVTIHNLSRQLQRYALFVTLARYDSTLSPEPYLARSWEWSGDRRSLTMSLATDVMWHDGERTTSKDVAFTIDAARNPETGYPRQSDLADITGVSAPDDSTVVVQFGTAQPSFPSILCELPIVPRHLLSGVELASMRSDRFGFSPTGNGPFRFASRTTGQRWLFERNSEFSRTLGGPPSIDRLVIAVVDEPTTKFAGLVSGELDFAGIAPSMASLARRDSRLRVIAYPVLFVNTLAFNTTRKPFDDRRLRRAISASIDRERIVNAALAEFGVPSSAAVSPASPWAVVNRSAKPDTVLADSLFDAIGWRRGPGGRRAAQGRPAGFTLLTVGSGDNAVEQLIQADLAARGVQVEIRQMELGAFLSQARASEKTFDVLVTGIPGDLSLAYLEAMFATRQRGGSLDYTGFHHPRLDTLFQLARRSADRDVVKAYWADIQQLLDDEMPVAWLYHARGVQGASRRVDNVVMDLRGELVSLHRWTVREGKR